MCYYNGVKVTRDEFIRLKTIEKLVAESETIRSVQSGFDYGDWPVLKAKAVANDFDIVKMEWGFVPSYLKNRDAVDKFRRGYKDESGKFHTPFTTLNIIYEEMLAPGKMFRDAALKRRCLVLSSGFYEWRHINPIGKRGEPLKTTVKYPYHIKVKDKPYFYMAGLWNSWSDKETGENVETFGIVTTKANNLMEQVHNIKKRMPTILPDDLAYDWLFGNLSEEKIKEIGSYQYPAQQMEAYSIKKDFKDALDPMESFKYEELPDLVLS